MGLRKKKSLIDQAAEYVESVKPHVESAVTTAKDKALPLLADARDKAAPVIADARDKAAPIIAEGASRAADKASLGASFAAEKAAIGKDLAAAKVAELKGEPPKKKGGKLKKLFLFGGLAAIGTAVFKKVKGDQASDNWQSSYVPNPPPPPPAPVRDIADDTAGSSPDEAMSDASDEPHAATTPDQPADTVTIDEDAANKG